MPNTPPTFPLLPAVLFALVFAGCVYALRRDRVRLWVFLVTVVLVAGMFAAEWLIDAPRVRYQDLLQSGLPKGLLWGFNAGMPLLAIGLKRIVESGAFETLLRGPQSVILWLANLLATGVFCYWLQDAPSLNELGECIRFTSLSAVASALPYSLSREWLERRLHRRYVAQRLGLAQQPSPSLFRRSLLAAGLVARGTERASDSLINSRRQMLVKLLIGSCALFLLQPVLGQWVNVILILLMAAAGLAGLVLLVAWLLKRYRSRPPKPARPLLPLPLTCPLPDLGKTIARARYDQLRPSPPYHIEGGCRPEIWVGLFIGAVMCCAFLQDPPLVLDSYYYRYPMEVQDDRSTILLQAAAAAIVLTFTLLIAKAWLPWGWLFRRRHSVLLHSAIICLLFWLCGHCMGVLIVWHVIPHGPIR